MDERKSQPILLVVLLGLLGLSALPRGFPTDSSAPKSTTLKVDGEPANDGEPSKSAAAPTASDNPDLAVLAPLLELVDDGSSGRIDERLESLNFDSAGRRGLVREIVTRTQEHGGKVRAMIALVPDPVRTSAEPGF